MIILKTDDEIEMLRGANLLVAKTLGELAKEVKPGTTTKQLNNIANEYIRDNGGVPAFQSFPNYYITSFPGSICTSVNEVVVHGIPCDKYLQDGDIVSIECGVLFKGFGGESCYTFCVGEVKPEIKKMLQVAKRSLYVGIQQAVIGHHIGDISHAIQKEVDDNGFEVIRELVGHGIGKDIYESPNVPNYGKKGEGEILKNGMCITVEPMIAQHSRQICKGNDGWSITMIDGGFATHYEHTIAIRKEGADILSSFEFIEKVLESNAV